MIITKDGDGNVTAIELSEASPEEAATLAVLGVKGTRLLGQEDVEEIGGALDPNSTAALMIWENVWAAKLAEIAAQCRRDPDRERPDPSPARRRGHVHGRLMVIGSVRERSKRSDPE